MSFKPEDALAVAQNYTDKKFKDAISEKFGEAKIDDDGNLIITIVDTSTSFNLNENGELILTIDESTSEVTE